MHVVPVPGILYVALGHACGSRDPRADRHLSLLTWWNSGLRAPGRGVFTTVRPLGAWEGEGQWRRNELGTVPSQKAVCGKWFPSLDTYLFFFLRLALRLTDFSCPTRDRTNPGPQQWEWASPNQWTTGDIPRTLQIEQTWSYHWSLIKMEMLSC